jgi:septal ring factor EnvC (AmiA/AmiB activator)
MSFFPDFTPIEYRGMSVITGLILFFAGVGITVVVSFIKKEIKDQDERFRDELKHRKESIDMVTKRVDQHDDKLSQFKDDMGDMKTNIALLLQSCKRIESFMEKQYGSP